MGYPPMIEDKIHAVLMDGGCDLQELAKRTGLAEDQLKPRLNILKDKCEVRVCGTGRHQIWLTRRPGAKCGVQSRLSPPNNPLRREGLDGDQPIPESFLNPELNVRLPDTLNPSVARKIKGKFVITGTDAPPVEFENEVTTEGEDCTLDVTQPPVVILTNPDPSPPPTLEPLMHRGKPNGYRVRAYTPAKPELTVEICALERLIVRNTYYPDHKADEILHIELADIPALVHALESAALDALA